MRFKAAPVQYEDGWVQVPNDSARLDAYWRSSIADTTTPAATTDSESVTTRLVPLGPVPCPVLNYDDGGIGHVQWLNLTHNRAAIVIADGGWKKGGAFRLWVSAGAGTEPFEISLGHYSDFTFPRGGSDMWSAPKDRAIAAAQALLCLKQLNPPADTPPGRAVANLQPEAPIRPVVVQPIDDTPPAACAGGACGYCRQCRPQQAETNSHMR